MSEMFEPSPEQFGVFWDFLMQPDVTDVDYNGSALWITDLKKGKYRAKEAEEKVTENFLDAFTHNIANCVDAQFNNANKVLEADTKELRISIIHDSVAATGTSVCIRRSPCLVRNTINGMLNSGFCEEKVLHLFPCKIVKRGKRLIHHDKGRLIRQRPRDRRPLLHSAGELCRICFFKSR